MTSRFYELRDDLYHPGRWHLRSPVDEHGQKINPWQFTEGRQLDPQGSIRFPVKPDGVELEFTQSSFSIPVLHRRVVQLFERLGIQDVQFLPAEVQGHAGPWFILNALRVIRCIDETRCREVRHFKPEDGQPERVGEYRVVSGLRIDPTKAGGARVFRPWGWRMVLLVSDDIKQALEREGITGPVFTEV
ncbi:imm11 family protein [Archangium violaceum]|uniref:imm11 family protein n=1 Tax=Archangium violaceum TaxID=83451 RepID=UPI0036DB5D0A